MQIDKWYHLYGRKDDIVLEEVPKPEPERKKWKVVSIMTTRNREEFYEYSCSCGCHRVGFVPPRYCEGCGAEME